MVFELDHHWVWDYWLADDGETYHLYYLRARKSLGDPELRHRNARIGHATSDDLTLWTDRGEVLAPGPTGSFDEAATWTGSVVKSHDGTWFMFYTGAVFDDDGNHQSIGFATSPDLYTWSKADGFVLEADPRWYEKRGDSSWSDEAWRDPWVYFDDANELWHMLITARSNSGADDERGVIGHATSPDLRRWTVQPPLSAPDTGFAHLEVPQVEVIDGRPVLLFSCNTPALSLERRQAGQRGGIWSVALDSAIPTVVDSSEARLVATDELYSGRIARTRTGDAVVIAFEADTLGGDFVGRITDPMPIRWSSDGASLVLSTTPAR